MSNEPKYPKIKVKLTGTDSNAFFIMGRVSAAMREAGVPRKVIDEYVAEATSGDYDHLLTTTMRWVVVS